MRAHDAARLGVGVILLLGAGAIAQPTRQSEGLSGGQPADQPANQSDGGQADPSASAPAAESPPGLLSGPKVEPAAEAATLIRVGYSGRIERVADAQPEVAALELVELDAEGRGRIEDRLEARAAFIDAAVLEHYETLLELYTAFGAGDEREIIRLYLEFASHLQPLFKEGGLGRQLASEMAEQTRAEYGRLLREYYASVARDILDHPEDDRGNPPENAAAAIRNYKIQLLMEEVGRSFARIVRQKTQEYEEVLTALRLSPEREGQIRASVEQFAQEFGFNPNEAQKRQIFQRLMTLLEPGERQRLLAWVLR